MTQKRNYTRKNLTLPPDLVREVEFNLERRHGETFSGIVAGLLKTWVLIRGGKQDRNEASR